MRGAGLVQYARNQYLNCGLGCLVPSNQRVLPAKTAAAIGERQILPRHTIVMLSWSLLLSEEIKLWFIFKCFLHGL